MANLRVIYDNAADRAATLVASTTAGSLAASNMQNDFKGQVHRSGGTSVTYTLTWSTAESIGGVALPATNLSASATIRVRLYSDTAGTSLLYDSTAIYAASGQSLSLWNWTEAVNANAFAYGGLVKVQVWADQHYAAQCCVIDIADSTNAAGYIDCARLVIGGFWEAAMNPDYGDVEITPMDSTESRRNDSGDNLSDRGTQFDEAVVTLKGLEETDRATLMRIARNAGAARNIFMSVFPGNDSPVVEQDFCIYGKRKPASLAAWFPALYSTKLELEGW